MKYYYTINEIINKKNKLINKKVFIKGWIKYFRNNIFLIINDGSTINNIQVVLSNKLKNKKYNIGLNVEILGILKFYNNDIEVEPLNLKLCGEMDIEFFNNSILQNKFHNLYNIRKQYYLRSRTKVFSSIFRIRHNLSFLIHSYLFKKSFFYVNTPIINNYDAEGAGNMFNVTIFDKKKNSKNNFFSSKTNLTVSGQLELESLMLGLCKVYTFGPVFRAENSNTNKHLAEFWMIEIEIMFYDLNKIIKFSESFIKFLIKKILIYSLNDLLFLSDYYKNNLISYLKNILKNKFLKISYNKAVKLLNNYSNNIIKWGNDISSKHEKILFKKIFKNNLPLIIYNYPKVLKPFYMKINNNNLTTKSFDILFPYIGEIIGGSEREFSYEKLLLRIKELKMNEKILYWYLNIRKLGTIIHSGFGLGFDRLVQFITGIKNIRDVIPFPRYPRSF
ncbi:MAG: asparagine--tRNA ligase [Candidatus Shikimatogenerans sp. JK-2022]|nr:asparagine--tRNA ligase [Candidatus Shikimatogenerans bostrichidophilus]